MTNSFGMEFVSIPPGTFLMGSDAGHAGENPRHEVTITRSFHLGVTPVTQAQYEAVTGSKPSHFRGRVKSRPENPVEQVSWLDALTFCNILSALEGRRACYELGPAPRILEDGTGYRLPTEAEWEYACRAGSADDYGFGDDVAKLPEYAWFLDNADRSTKPVAKKRANGFGLHDMHGNVFEWCWDGFDAGYYAESQGAKDPRGPSEAKSRVLRGGSCFSFACNARSAYRLGIPPDCKDSIVGIRVALVESDRD